MGNYFRLAVDHLSQPYASHRCGTWDQVRPGLRSFNRSLLSAGCSSDSSDHLGFGDQDVCLRGRLQVHSELRSFNRRLLSTGNRSDFSHHLGFRHRDVYLRGQIRHQSYTTGFLGHPSLPIFSSPRTSFTRLSRPFPVRRIVSITHISQMVHGATTIYEVRTSNEVD